MPLYLGCIYVSYYISHSLFLRFIHSMRWHERGENLMKEERFKSVRGTWPTITDFGNGGNVPWTKEYDWPLEAGNGPHVTTRRGMGISISQPQGATLRQQTEWANGKWSFSIASRQNEALPIPWFWPSETYVGLLLYKTTK